MFEQKQYHAAVGWYQRNCDRPGTDIEALEVNLLNLGLAQKKAADLRGAVDSYSEALALAGTNYQAAVSGWEMVVDELKPWVGTAREYDIDAMLPYPAPLVGKRVVVYGTSRDDLNETMGECVKISRQTGRYQGDAAWHSRGVAVAYGRQQYASAAFRCQPAAL